jgi:hypothetical protein
MKILAFFALAAFAASAVSALAYPKAPTSNQVDDYHGTSVADPYRPSRIRTPLPPGRGSPRKTS